MATNRDRMLEYVKTNAGIAEEPDVLKADCDNIVFILDHCEITIDEANTYFVQVDCDGLQWTPVWMRAEKYRNRVVEKGLMVGQEAKAYSGGPDFSHTTIEWETVLKLGIVGLRNRLVDYRKRDGLESKQVRFYTECLRVYDAALRFMKRTANTAKTAGRMEMATGLYHLCKNPPKNLFEAMQTMLVYYVLQHMVEGTNLRTLGRLDKLFYPYYIKEDKTRAAILFNAFLREIDTLKAPSNIPFAIGGTDVNGHSLVNELSYLVLETYQTVTTNNTKFHLLYSSDTPADLIEQAFRGIRDGHNSLVFLSDNKVIAALEKLGAKHEDVVNYHIVGCYECGADGELTCSCNARVNIPKALEVTLNNGCDMITGKKIGLENDEEFNTFDALYTAFEKQLLHFADCAMQITDIYEGQYANLHSAAFLSATYASAMAKGGDLYCDYAARYNNSSLNAIGLATAVDSLAAIRKLVFEDHTCSLNELKRILKNNWKDWENLRLAIKHKYPKFGVGDRKTDALAKSIVEAMSAYINGKSNVKGGVYRLGTFSINWRWELGNQTAASADGRLSGEPLSQNTSASFGADKEGATAHLLSVTAFDSIHTPNGSIVDLDLHISAVQGENGIRMLAATMKTYFQMGGFAVHYNILDTEVLRRAKQNPQDYPNLQVRLCGWNVLFSNLSEKEKEDFIARSEKRGQRI